MADLVETGVSFTVRGSPGEHWHKHSVGLSSEYVASKLDHPALHRFQALPLMRQIFVIRAVAEIALCKFRATRRDPDYRDEELKAWVEVIEKMLGPDGISRLGIVS